MTQATHYVADVSPALAAEFLAKNTHNRKINQSAVNEYSRAMKEGRWNFDGSPIRRTTDFDLLDGQHRLLAVVESGTTQKFSIWDGVAREAQQTMDIGRKRTLADVLTFQGYKYPNDLSALLHIARQWSLGKRGYTLTKVDTRGGNGQIPEFLDFLAANPDLIEAVEKGKHIRSQFRGPRRILSLAYWVFSHIDQEEADDFFDKLAKGTGLEENSPIWVLRETMTKYTASKVMRANESSYFLAITIKAWNAYREGREIKLLKFSLGGKNPETFPIPL